MQLYSDKVWCQAQGKKGFHPALITIEGAHIVSVSPLVRSLLPEGHSTEDPILDLGDKLVTPAMVNAHTHLPMVAFRALGGRAAQAGNVVEDLWFRIEGELTAEDVRAFTRVGAYECLATGCATVFEHYYHADAVISGFEDTGLTGAIAPTLQDINGPGLDAFDAQLDATVRLACDEERAQAGLVAMLGAHATDTVSHAAWRRILDVATGHQLPIHTHVAQSLEEVQRAAAQGMTCIERLQSAGVFDANVRALWVHLLYANDKDLALLDPQLHQPVACPWSWTMFGFVPQTHRWESAGLKMLVGTDAGASNDTMNVQQELRLLALAPSLGVTWSNELKRFQRGEGTADDVNQRRGQQHAIGSGPGLAAVWEHAAYAHPKLPVGRLQAGYFANIAIWDPQHPALWPCTDPERALVYGDAQGALWGLLSAGKWVGEQGSVGPSLWGNDTVRGHLQEATDRLNAIIDRLHV